MKELTMNEVNAVSGGWGWFSSNNRDYTSRLRSDTNPSGGMWGNNSCTQKEFVKSVGGGAVIGAITTRSPWGAATGAVSGAAQYVTSCWW